MATKDIQDEVLELKQQEGRDIFVCSRSLIAELTRLNLIDEYQLCVHPIIAGSGLPLFENIKDKIFLKLVRTKTLRFGGIVL